MRNMLVWPLRLFLTVMRKYTNILEVNSEYLHQFEIISYKHNVWLLAKLK